MPIPARAGGHALACLGNGLGPDPSRPRPRFRRDIGSFPGHLKDRIRAAEIEKLPGRSTRGERVDERQGVFGDGLAVAVWIDDAFHGGLGREEPVLVASIRLNAQFTQLGGIPLGAFLGLSALCRPVVASASGALLGVLCCARPRAAWTSPGA